MPIDQRALPCIPKGVNLGNGPVPVGDWFSNMNSAASPNIMQPSRSCAALVTPGGHPGIALTDQHSLPSSVPLGCVQLKTQPAVKSCRWVQPYPPAMLSFPFSSQYQAVTTIRSPAEGVWLPTYGMPLWSLLSGSPQQYSRHVP